MNRCDVQHALSIMTLTWVHEWDKWEQQEEERIVNDDSSDSNDSEEQDDDYEEGTLEEGHKRYP